MIETKRLLLREYTMDDFDALYEIMSDSETMQHYPAPFDEARTRRWIEWNLENYAQYGFGLWAVVLKETDEFIGDCGITIQNIDGDMLPEIGYHIHKEHEIKDSPAQVKARLGKIFNEAVRKGTANGVVRATTIKNGEEHLKFYSRAAVYVNK